VSPQTDVYSLGVMAYELFLEQLPFEAETSAEIMAMHLRATPPPPSELWPDIPPGLEHLMLAMLAKDPSSRPTMLTVAHTLELVRSELRRRREDPSEVTTATPVVPDTSRSARLKSAPGLAPTEPAAEWREGRKPWHFVVGAFALAASTAMFLVSRDTETAAAAPDQPAAASSQQQTPPDPAAPASAPTDTTKSDRDTRDVPVAITKPAAATAPAPTPPAEPKLIRTSTSTSAPARHSSPSPRKLPVKPRRDVSNDPDGTVDPYL
jgi:serine/threonine-protein kinase